MYEMDTTNSILSYTFIYLKMWFIFFMCSLHMHIYSHPFILQNTIIRHYYCTAVLINECIKRQPKISGYQQKHNSVTKKPEIRWLIK